MTNNDVMKSVRYTLHLKNAEVVEVFKLAGMDVSILDVVGMLKKEDEEGYIECTAPQLHAFLDGVITKLRGPKDEPAKPFPTDNIDNNTILRKIRIAFTLKDTDIIAMLKKVQFNISKAELGALFRNKYHKNYKKCGDQFLRNFLKALTEKFRK